MAWAHRALSSLAAATTLTVSRGYGDACKKYDSGTVKRYVVSYVTIVADVFMIET